MSHRLVTLPAPAVDESFEALGTRVRLVADGRGARSAVDRARAAILDYHARLSRFRTDSELSLLNRDARTTVPASALLRSAVRAGLWAAQRSGGLVDPCLLAALEAVGYVESYRRRASAGPLPSGPVLRGEPAPDRRWRSIAVDDDAGTITRPPGLRLDLGGSGKGHVADLVADGFEGLRGWVVDCGGDIRVGGARAVEIAHPLRAEPAAALTVVDGALATSSVVSRAWRDADGNAVHHLLDPRTGRPAWTGLITASALAPTVLEAETLAKMALLRGPARARALLATDGGVLVHGDGAVETVGLTREAAA